MLVDCYLILCLVIVFMFCCCDLVGCAFRMILIVLLSDGCCDVCCGFVV